MAPPARQDQDKLVRPPVEMRIVKIITLLGGNHYDGS